MYTVASTCVRVDALSGTLPAAQSASRIRSALIAVKAQSSRIPGEPTSRRALVAVPRAAAVTPYERFYSSDEVNEEVVAPTPVLPSGIAMADFLLTFRRVLEHMNGTGDAIAAAGATVLQSVRIGVTALIGHPHHGRAAGANWHREEKEVEKCLWELEKDLSLIERAHEHTPSRTALAMASIHCYEAARLLRRL